METFQRTNLLMGRVDGLVIFPGVDWWCLGVFANLISCAFSLVSLVLFQSRLRSAPQPANKKVFQRLKDWLKQYQNTPEVCKFSDFHAPSWMTWCVYTLLKDWFRGFDLESDKAQRGGDCSSVSWSVSGKSYHFCICDEIYKNSAHVHACWSMFRNI